MLDLAVIQRFVRRQFQVRDSGAFDIVPLMGGLEAEGIARVTVATAPEIPLPAFVVKPLAGSATREAVVHRLLPTILTNGPAPRALGWEWIRPGAGYLFVEWVDRAHSWPWRQTRCAALVLESMAQVHNAAAVLPPRAATWDYESELQVSARSTIDLYLNAWCAGTRPATRAMYRAMERILGDLPAMRRQLMEYTGTALLHGDVHPGNAIIADLRTGPRALLLDWGRARTGSPLEDVSSWLQTLAFWEPEARRSHDTLLRWYLEYAGWTGGITSGLREAYWFAGACNALAGALRYHLAVLGDEERTPKEKVQSRAAAADWLRILRRADTCWRA